METLSKIANDPQQTCLIVFSLYNMSTCRRPISVVDKEIESIDGSFCTDLR